jgi:putative transposase
MQQQFFRQHTRLRDFDYRSNHAYFVTLVTAGRECVFGSIADGVLRPSRRGLVVQQCWHDIPNHHPFVELDAFILMPNHLHGVVLFVGNDIAPDDPVAATPASPPRESCRIGGGRGPTPHSLGAVIGSFKAAVSRKINRIRAGAAAHLWQPSYYEHVVRDDGSLDAIRNYVVANPLRWMQDADNPDGDRTDDVRTFVRALDVERAPCEATQASQLRESDDR